MTGAGGQACLNIHRGQYVVTEGGLWASLNGTTGTRDMSYLYTLMGDEADLELAGAELWALAGCRVRGRLGQSQVACDVSRSAYVALCARILAHATTLEGLCSAVADAGVNAEAFRVDVHKMAPRVDEPTPDIARRVAEVMRGLPDLSTPRERYAVICRRGEWWLGRVVSVSRRGYRTQAGRPRNLSIALTVRHARALVNMVAAPGDTLLDPCCGAGTCLVEAGLMGIRAVGRDISRGAVAAAEANLAHFGLPGEVEVADARDLEGTFDAAVVDFPYGHTTKVAPGMYEQVLENLAPRVFRLGVVLGGPAEALFSSLSLPVLSCARVQHNRLVRHFTVLKGLKDRGGAI